MIKIYVKLKYSVFLVTLIEYNKWSNDILIIYLNSQMSQNRKKIRINDLSLNSMFDKINLTPKTNNFKRKCCDK